MTGAELIAAERQRQVEHECRTPEHDDQHDRDELALAAVAYTLPVGLRGEKHVAREYRASGRWSAITDPVPTCWPFDGFAWKPTPDDRIRELVKAGALIAAEIDRLSRRPA